MNAEQEYLESKVMTATPAQLHLMVVDGAIRYATQAVQALDEHNYETTNLALNNARAFVAELISGLDEEQAPELVGQLKGLFFFVYRNLVDADLKHDVGMVHDALKVLRMHRETWVELTEKLKTETLETSVVPAPKSIQTQEQRSWTT